MRVSSKPPVSRPAVPVKFACRLFAFVSNRPLADQDQFIRRCLDTGDNALRKQSEKRPGLPGHASKGNEDGWGIAVYEGNRLTITRSARPAHQDERFSHAAGQGTGQAGTVLGHVRAGNSPRVDNAHPFQQNHMTFMHNGFIPEKALVQIRQELADYRRTMPLPAPKGSTDTEVIFLWLLGRLKSAYPDREPETLSTEQIGRVFADSVQRLIQLGRKSDQGAITHLHGLPVAAGYNFVLSDGKRVWATRRGRELYLGHYKQPDGTEAAMLSSEPVETGKIRWQPVPEDALIMLERRPDKVNVIQKRWTV